MRKQLGHIPQLVGFQPMDRLVLHPKRLHKGIAPARVEKTEAGGNHTVVSKEGPLLRAALDNHVDKLRLSAQRYVHLGQLVRALLKRCRRHDGEVDRTSQVHQIRLRQIMNDLRLLLVRRRSRYHRLTSLLLVGFLVIVVRTASTAVRRRVGIAISAAAAIVVAVLSQNLPPDLGPGRLVLNEAGIEPEHVQHLVLLQVVVVVQTELEHDLVVGLDQIELGDDAGVVLEVPLPVLHQHLHLVLDPPADRPVVEEAAEPLHDGPDPGGTDLQQRLADDPHVRDGHLDGIVGRVPVEEDGEELQAQQLVRHALVEELAEEGSRRHGLGLVAAAVRPLELQDGPAQHQLAQLGELGVDDGDEGGVHVGVGGGGGGGPQDGLGQQAPAADEIALVEQLVDEGLDGGGVEAVDGAVDELPQLLPGLALRGHVGRGGLKGAAAAAAIGLAGAFAVLASVLLAPLFSLLRSVVVIIFNVNVLSPLLRRIVLLLLPPLQFLHGPPPLFDHPLPLMRRHVHAQLVRVGGEGPIRRLRLGRSGNVGISSHCSRCAVAVLPARARSAAASQSGLDHAPAPAHVEVGLGSRRRRCTAASSHRCSSTLVVALLLPGAVASHAGCGRSVGGSGRRCGGYRDGGGGVVGLGVGLVVVGRLIPGLKVDLRGVVVIIGAVTSTGHLRNANLLRGGQHRHDG